MKSGAWGKLPPVEGFVACLSCGCGAHETLELDREISVGLGRAGYSRDGEILWEDPCRDDVTPPTVEDVEKLAAAKDGPLQEIAARLRKLAGTERPLAVARLRGGVFRDDGWARLPSQPAIITSTVDQLGSRLLVRGYGRSHLAVPIFAGLAAHDSLVLLDEAHCSVPFVQTLRAIERYRGKGSAEVPLPSPFAFVVMSGRRLMCRRAKSFRASTSTAFCRKRPRSTTPNTT